MYIFSSAFIWLLTTTRAARASYEAEQRIIQPTTTCPLESLASLRTAAICPTDVLGSVGTGATTSFKEEWIKGTVCHEVPGGSDSRYCTFTHPTFNHGLGISIITTPEVFQKFSKRPVFGKNDENHAPLERDMSSLPPYKDMPIPGKGIGLVAARPIKVNEVYLARTPAVMLDDTAFRLLGRSRLTALLVKAVDDLPYTHRSEYLNLTTHNEVESHADRVYQIFMRNNFRTEVENIEVFHSTFTQVSRLNHACRSNSDYFFDDATLSHNVFAARNVDPREELTVTYSDPIQTYMSRQMYLLHNWGFECTCSLCTASEAEIEKSDARIDQIQSLWANLDNYTPTSAATPEQAERLIDLYHEEGLVTRMVESYYRVAVEWNGVGQSEKAKIFAEKAISAGQIMESGIRPFLNNMRELAKNPEGHWTWRFRERNNA